MPALSDIFDESSPYGKIFVVYICFVNICSLSQKTKFIQSFFSFQVMKSDTCGSEN
eukprot:TRINITY_DN2401_c1_g1_i1.p1 TRINITY_DN2401_c1_g1~~TRINITY_DN2401_c1_g1_i1.p1  ORF type:complete len:56 (+),score=7.24 TRINITY_DN2401_c1_g1_i1:52-219(+)